MQARRWKGVAALAAVTALLAGFASGAEAKTDVGTSQSAGAPIKVGIVYTRTGLLATYGAQYIQGLRYGLAYATRGTNSVNGRKIELTLVDDAFDATKAVAAGKDLIGKGYKILAGSTGSGIAAQMAPLAAQNKVLFISGPAAVDCDHGDQQVHVPVGPPELPGRAHRELLPRRWHRQARHRLRAGLGLRARQLPRRQVRDRGSRRASGFRRILVPLSAQDFTPFAQQLKSSGAASPSSPGRARRRPAVWRALEQQNVFGGSMKVVTGLDQRSTYATFGPVASKIDFLSHYVYTAPKNVVNDFLVRSMRKRGQVPDLFTPDGFVAGQMIVRALQKGSATDVEKMISALEGWNFTGPKGQQRDPRRRPRDVAADVPGAAQGAGERQVQPRRPQAAAREVHRTPGDALQVDGTTGLEDRVHDDADPRHPWPRA